VVIARERGVARRREREGFRAILAGAAARAVGRAVVAGPPLGRSDSPDDTTAHFSGCIAAAARPLLLPPKAVSYGPRSPRTFPCIKACSRDAESADVPV
jgi:hypothetical protein